MLFIAAWRYSDDLLEHPVKIRRIIEPDKLRNGTDPALSVFKQFFGFLDSLVIDIVCDIDPRLFLEYAADIIFIEVKLVGKHIQIDRFRKMAVDIFNNAVDHFIIVGRLMLLGDFKKRLKLLFDPKVCAPCTTEYIDLRNLNILQVDDLSFAAGIKQTIVEHFVINRNNINANALINTQLL